MLTLTDHKGLLHVIPRERIASISMFECSAEDPADSKVKLVITHDHHGGHNQIVMYLGDRTMIEQMKQVLRVWASNDDPNYLHIDAGVPPPPIVPEAAAIGL